MSHLLPRPQPTGQPLGASGPSRMRGGETTHVCTRLKRQEHAGRVAQKGKVEEYGALRERAEWEPSCSSIRIARPPREPRARRGVAESRPGELRRWPPSARPSAAEQRGVSPYALFYVTGGCASLAITAMIADSRGSPPILAADRGSRSLCSASAMPISLRSSGRCSAGPERRSSGGPRSPLSASRGCSEAGPRPRRAGAPRPRDGGASRAR